MRFSALIYSAVFVAATICTGCGGDGTVKVSGTVTLDGAPLANVQVNFDSPTGKVRPASGMTNGEGKFKLKTIKENDGAMPGEYKVTVAKLGPAADMSNKDAFKKMQEQAKQKTDSGIHDNYTNFAKTPLKVTVPVKGELVLALKKDGT